MVSAGLRFCKTSVVKGCFVEVSRCGVDNQNTVSEVAFRLAACPATDRNGPQRSSYRKAREIITRSDKQIKGKIAMNSAKASVCTGKGEERVLVARVLISQVCEPQFLNMYIPALLISYILGDERLRHI